LLEGFTVFKMLVAAWVFFGVYAISQIEETRYGFDFSALYALRRRSQDLKIWSRD